MATCDASSSLTCGFCEQCCQFKDDSLMFPCLHSFCKLCLAKYIKKEQSTADMKMISCPTCKDHFLDASHFPVEKKELQSSLNNAECAFNEVDQTLQLIQQMRNKVKVSAEEATARVNRACDDLIQAVENRRKILLGKCQEIAEGKDDVLSSQTLGMECLRKDLSSESVQLHAINFNNHSTEEIGIPIQFQVDDKLQKYRKQSMELRENDYINISLLTEALIEEIQKFGIFSGVPDPSKCQVEGLVTCQATVGRAKEVTIILKDEAEKLVEDATCFQYQLRRVDDDPDDFIPHRIDVSPSNKNDETAKLIFIPDQSGEYQLTIMVRNKPIVDPYNITVRHPGDYTNFQNMEVTHMNIGGQCRDVAVHDNGTVYVTNKSDHNVKVFRPDGTEGQIGGPDTAAGGLFSPWGITILEKTLYVVSNGNHMVKRYSIDGRFIGEFGGNGNGNGQFSYPLGICTDENGRIFVADQTNKRIQIFSSEGEFITLFQCSNFPYDVATDKVGNIHVALPHNNHIAVFSKDGRQIDTYNMEGKLHHPTGIHIDGRGNRLIGTSSNQVHITNQTGMLISTRRINGGRAVTMDKNGVVYVAEYSKNCISVYS